jgi:hypothetical protein
MGKRRSISGDMDQYLLQGMAEAVGKKIIWARRCAELHREV